MGGQEVGDPLTSAGLPPSCALLHRTGPGPRFHTSPFLFGSASARRGTRQGRDREKWLFLLPPWRHGGHDGGRTVLAESTARVRGP